MEGVSPNADPIHPHRPRWIDICSGLVSEWRLETEEIQVTQESDLVAGRRGKLDRSNLRSMW